MTITLQLDSINGTAVFTGLTPADIGAVSNAVVTALSNRVSLVELDIVAHNTRLTEVETYASDLDVEIANLTSASVGLSNVIQDDVSGEVTLNAGSNVQGQFTINSKLEVKNAFTGGYYYPWSESTKHSVRLDMWSDDDTREYELSIFRDTYTTNAKAGLAVYKPNQTNTVNHYLAATGESYLCGNNGFLGVGFATNPSERLHVNGSIRATNALKLGTNINQISYAAAAPTTSTYKRGDIVFNNAPSASGLIGWVCVTAGTPGTWKTFGQISA